MPQIELDLNPITHITTDAIGQPGQRTFYIQAWQDERVVSLIVEKVQIQTLAVGLDQYLAELDLRSPNLSPASPAYDEEKMHIHPPVDPLFRVGELGLGYDAESDKIILVAREVQASDDQPEEEANIVRFWCSRSQLLAMCRWGLEVASRGRPLCPQCGEPMEPEGHFCPKKNGHKH